MRQPPWPLALALLAALYLGLRLPALGALPLFNDEAVYLVRALDFPAMLFAWGSAGATFPDGKLLHELLLATLAQLPAEQLVAGRLLSAACGLATTLALAQMGRGLGHGAAGLLAGALYALAPLAAIHDVLAVPDSMLTLASALVLWASLRLGLGERAGAGAGLATGALIVVAALVKLPGLLLAATPALALAILPGSRGERWRRAPAALLAVAVAAGGYLLLRELGYGLAERHKLAGAGLAAGLVGANLGLATGWMLRYLPGVLLAAPALVLWEKLRQAVRPSPTGPAGRGFQASQRLVLFLLLAGLSYIAGFVVAGQTLYSRYLLPAWPALLLAAALAAAGLWAGGGWRRGLAGVCVGAALGWGAVFQGWLIVAPLGAPMAAGDRFQYSEGWPAGQGLDRLGADLRAAALARPGLVVVSGEEIRLGNLAARLALRGVPGARAVLVDLGADDGPARVAALGRQGPLAVVVDAETAAAYGLGERFAGLLEWRRYPRDHGEGGFVLFVAGEPAEFFVPE